MRILLCDVGHIPQEDLERAARALPQSRVPRASTRPHAFAARVVGTLLATYAAKQLSPQTDTENWLISDAGKPRFAKSPLHFSISHTDTLVALAISLEAEVGIDVERVRPMQQGFAARYFSDAEQAQIRDAADPAGELIRLWTAKEAVAKRHGTGLGWRVAEIDKSDTVSAFLEKAGVRYALSLSPKCTMPALEWVDFQNLVP